jgi:ABC-type transporter MlaC component
LLVQSAIGAHWVSLTAEQRTGLIEAFEQYAVSLCAAFFDGYSGQRFEIVGEAKTSTGVRVFWSRSLPGRSRPAISVRFVASMPAIARSVGVMSI